MNDGLGKLLERAPCEMGRFEKTEYPDPVVLALHGKIVKVMDLKKKAKKQVKINLSDPDNPPREKEIEGILYSSLPLVEAIEASIQDKDLVNR